MAQKLPKIAQMAQKLPKMAQKLAPAKKNSRDISPVSPTFSISESDYIPPSTTNLSKIHSCSLKDLGYVKARQQ